VRSGTVELGVGTLDVVPRPGVVVVVVVGDAVVVVGAVVGRGSAGDGAAAFPGAAPRASVADPGGPSASAGSGDSRDPGPTSSPPSPAGRDS
jgi:hypothetical protein